MTDLTKALKKEALAEGFNAVRICRPDAIEQAAGQLQDFVDAGFHGQMGWMADRMQWRGNPAALWPDAKSVIVLAENYAPDHDPTEILNRPDRGAISVYAQNRDYHDILKKRLKRVGRWLVNQGKDVEIKVFVDTAPVMEKPLAQAAGLGWQGKHSNLVSREMGNWFFLGSIFTTLKLDIDAPETDHCGNCRRCLDICPTNAFAAPYRLDARRCISYLTIEHHGPIDESLRPLIGNHIFGCDDCLAVCPWNKYAQQARDSGYVGRVELKAPALVDLVGLDDAAFRQLFSKSPVKRIGRDRFVRNVLYAIGNSGDLSLAGAARSLLPDPDETVADAAGWALTRLKDQT